LNELPEEDYDDPLGISTGAGVIFGASGGVMEAALRTVYEVVTGKTLGCFRLYRSAWVLPALRKQKWILDGTKVKDGCI
jgi:iron only hydrogenase large subunit-like protein